MHLFIVMYACHFIGMSDDESDDAVTDRGSTTPLQLDSPTEGLSESRSSTAPRTDSNPVINKVPSGKVLPKSSSTNRTKLERSLEVLCDRMAASEMDRN